MKAIQGRGWYFDILFGLAWWFVVVPYWILFVELPEKIENTWKRLVN